MGLLKYHWTVKSLVIESHREILSGVKSVHFFKLGYWFKSFDCCFLSFKWFFIFGCTVYKLSSFSVHRLSSGLLHDSTLGHIYKLSNYTNICVFKCLSKIDCSVWISREHCCLIFVFFSFFFLNWPVAWVPENEGGIIFMRERTKVVQRMFAWKATLGDRVRGKYKTKYTSQKETARNQTAILKQLCKILRPMTSQTID